MTTSVILCALQVLKDVLGKASSLSDGDMGPCMTEVTLTEVGSLQAH
jgi:hypothetical protein